MSSLPPPPPDSFGTVFADSIPKKSYAGFWRRVVASIIDSIITAIAFVIIGAGLALSAGESVSRTLAGEDGFNAPYAVLNIFSLVGGWLYSALMESSAKQATLGKMALSICVTDMDGRRISFGRATGRYFAKILSAIILLIGYIMAAFTARKQGLHDMIASTLVVQNVALPPDRRP